MSSSSTTAPNIPIRHRPIFEGLETGEAKMAAAMEEYQILKDADEDGLDFANKTSMWIAFERDIESQREDRLFNDILAKHFSEPYGQCLSDCMAFGLQVGVFDTPGSNIGLGMEGHVMYTAARTRLINDHIEKWMIAVGGNKQVVNLGAGVDTRPFWQSCLAQAKSYWEIDTDSVMKYKQARMDGLKGRGEIPRPMCPINSISMDFGKDSMADVLTKIYKFDSSIPTCWILEGLIMYLKRPDVEQLMNNISKLSPCASYLILNFSTNMPHTASPNIDEIDEMLGTSNWKKVTRLMFGEEGFHYNRYPEGKPANKILGFAMYQKEK